MKIRCLSVLLCLACLTLVASSSAHMSRLRLRSQKSVAKKTLVNVPDDTAALSPVATEDKGEPNKKKEARWSGVSNINLEITLLFAMAWVLVLGSAPILTYRIGEKELTKSAMVLSGLMWLALFGGLYLFTNIILFSSPHFDRVRSLTIIECTYFMTQVITTVGYGDITPAYPRGQVFVGAYVTLSFFVIALLMSEMQELVMHKVNKYKQELEHRLDERLHRSTASLEGTLDETTPSSSALQRNTWTLSAASSMGFKPEKPSPEGLIAAIGIFAGVAAVWVFFFHFYPGEDKLWLEAIYMSLITLTTVGFGAITPVTEGGMLFAAFFMFIGTSALVNVVQKFSTYILEMNQYEAWCPKEFEADLKKYGVKYGLAKGKDVSEEKFLILTLLQRKMVTEDQIDAIKASYVTMTGSKGKLNLKGIASNVSSEINHDELGDSDTEAATSNQPSAR